MLPTAQELFPSRDGGAKEENRLNGLFVEDICSGLNKSVPAKHLSHSQ